MPATSAGTRHPPGYKKRGALTSKKLAGGDDGTRTRDLMRDRRKQRVCDGLLQSEIKQYSCAFRGGFALPPNVTDYHCF
jgi:hypothetical protein